ncbi:MAG: nuclear transport factor 2 family protein [Coxiellaceae bacterium]|nr:MAG: nuclear transport factor 2 family protein [Coxiellaceae bacterium]
MSIDNIIDGFIAAIENRDTETISNFLDKNIVFENVPENHMILGCQGVKQMFANLFTKIMRIRWKIEHQLTHGNIAFIERKTICIFVIKDCSAGGLFY